MHWDANSIGVQPSNGGPGGGTTGGNADNTNYAGAYGGTATAGGAAGSAAFGMGSTPTAGSKYQGGTGNQYSGGGGGGYFGGGGGHIYNNGLGLEGGGGGGSSYIRSDLVVAGSTQVNTQASTYTVANNATLPSAVRGTIGAGGRITVAPSANMAGASGQNGYVVITFSV